MPEKFVFICSSGSEKIRKKERNEKMLKRIILFAFVLSTLAVIALAPMNLSSAPDNSVNLQETVAVTIEVGPTASSGGGAPAGMPTSTMIIVGLLVILGIAVVIGGMALMSRRA
jgi:hypothetical protein